MTALRIDRMTIDAPHLSEADGQRLAEQIATVFPSVARNLGGSVFAPRAASLTLAMTVKSDDVETLAREIAAELLRQLRS